MTQREKCIVSAYTGILMCDFDDFHKYVEETLGRPVWTHELAKTVIWDQVKEKSKEDFFALCREVEDGNREIT